MLGRKSVGLGLGAGEVGSVLGLGKGRVQRGMRQRRVSYGGVWCRVQCFIATCGRVMCVVERRAVECCVVE